MVFGGRCNVLNADSTSVVGFRYYNDVVLLDIGKAPYLRAYNTEDEWYMQFLC